MTNATAEHKTQDRTSRLPEVRAAPVPPPTSPTDGPRAHRPLRSPPAIATFPAIDEARTHLGPPPASPTDQHRPHRRATFGLTAGSDHLRPSRHFPQPMKPGRISGVCYPHSPTAFGPTARSGHFRQRRHFPLTAEVRTHFGRTAPTGPPSSGHAQRCPLLPLLPLPADLTYPSSIRRTCPVMTNDRVSPLSPLP